MTVKLVHPNLPGQPIHVASYEDVHRASGWQPAEPATDESTVDGTEVAPTGETPESPPPASPRQTRRSTES